ncbi:conserved hypothetical protein [Sulfolobus islandicus Y.N.15.51]|uniref:CRISPR system endoribonuclease Csx1 CARF domain-containing protein n=1 Tax=Saccharolobus islandicus (strain Y.N.15.51 / Yellowstone \|nr:TM1812 family CRISPR-associated protein [Sulfolobus islandicus]ACP49153.1 conserved hypothetical protein [Sulfolobus islandicus Y.N.15.51]
MRCLIYIAGDVMSYTPTNYEIEGREFNTFFSAHALAKLLSPQKIVALLPDSLIVRDDTTAKDLDILIKGYKNMILIRSNQLFGDENMRKDIEDFVNRIEVRVVPNVGSGQAYYVDNEGNLIPEGQRYKRSPYYSERSPVFIFNVVYSIFNEISKSCNEIIVDLTHGTNVLVSVTMAVGSLFNSRFVAAPVMGPPGQKVSIVDLTEVVKAMKDSLAITYSIEKVDERYFRDYSVTLKSLKPNEFKEMKLIIERIKSKDPNKVISLLKNLRNGFAVDSVRGMRDLESYINELERDVNELSKAYSEWYNQSYFEKENMIVLSHFYSTIKVRDLIYKGNDLEVLEKILGLYIKVGYYDKAISLARELPVAFCLNSRGGGVYSDFDKNYKECDEIVRNYLKESSILQFRNILMHGSLSKDVEAEVKEGRIELKNEIGLSTIENYITQKLENDYQNVKNKVVQTNT